MTELFDLTISQAASQIKDGALSPVTLMESLLGRVEALEPKLNGSISTEKVMNRLTRACRGGLRHARFKELC